MVLIDRWAALDFKDKLRRTNPKRNVSQVQPSWVGHHQRRLAAYNLLSSYLNNISRDYRATRIGQSGTLDGSELHANFDPAWRLSPLDASAQYREYGDAYLIFAQTLAAVLGDTQIVVVPGAAIAREATDATTSSEVTDATKAALQAEDYLRLWWEREMFQLKLIEAEGHAVGLGDGVYALGWDAEKHRVRARVYDPGSYFPVLDPESDNEFPDRVNIAYEFMSDTENKDVAEAENMIRRITWELIDGQCYFTDATWRSSQTGTSYSSGNGMLRQTNATVDRFDIAMAIKIRAEKVPMGVAFVPVVHIPNTISGADHYGMSILTMIAQILDDIMNTDTDLQKAAATTGTPPMALIGSRLSPGSKETDDDGVTTASYGPGDLWELEEGGDLKVVDTSHALDALLKLSEALQKRLAANARIPEALLGKVDPSKAPSGLAIALTFGPLTTMINQMRMVRRYKYGLLFKFVLVMALAARDRGDSDPSLANLPENLEILEKLPMLMFGNFMPSDLAETVKNVFELLSVKAITVETGLKMLQEAGIPIVSIKDEALRLKHADFAAAYELFQASGGDVAAVGAFLGLTLTRYEPPTPTVVAPTGGSGGNLNKKAGK